MIAKLLLLETLVVICGGCSSIIREFNPPEEKLPDIGTCFNYQGDIGNIIIAPVYCVVSKGSRGVGVCVANQFDTWRYVDCNKAIYIPRVTIVPCPLQCPPQMAAD